MAMKVHQSIVESTTHKSQVSAFLPGKAKIQNLEKNVSKAFVSHLSARCPEMPRQYKLGMVVHSDFRGNKHMASVSKPGSSCCLTEFVIIDEPNETVDIEDIESLLRRSILQKHEDTTVRLGQNGFEKLLESDADAVYIYVIAEIQKECVIRALKAGKHVLLNDPVSTSLGDFKEQQECAKRNGKFIQFCTMFDHQHNVRKFMDRVLCDGQFEQILKIECNVRVRFSEVEKVGATLPLGQNDGSIRVLGRFCILVSALFFSRVGIYAHSAKVQSAKIGGQGEILSAQCVVKFSNDRVLEFDVGYTNFATRQSIDILTDSKLAQMKDFIIEHPDRLATYRVYDRAPSPSSGTMEIKKGKAIDVYGGPTEEMMMWRRFAELSQSLDDRGGWDQSDHTAECRELANVALQTKRILIALRKSVENSFEEVIIDDIDYE